MRPLPPAAQPDATTPAGEAGTPAARGGGACSTEGIIAQADLAWNERLSDVGELVREVSRE